MTSVDIARIAHEVNRAYCKSIGDDSVHEWDLMGIEHKVCLTKGVYFHILHSDIVTPSLSHETWLKEKDADGWIYGEIKDIEKKEHPCMVNYDQLSLEQRTKSYLFGEVVKQLKKYLVPEVECHGD